jgi:hypothetical protein
MHAGGIEKRRHHPRRTQRVAHQCASSRAELDEAQQRRLAETLPDGHAPQADQLAEHLADFGSRYEVAGGADGVRLLPIAMLGIGGAGEHVFLDRDRA